MNKFLLYKNVRLHGETFEAGEVVEYNKHLDPSIAMLVKDYDGEYRKLSLTQGVYVYDDKKEQKIVSNRNEGTDSGNEPVKHIQKSKKK